VPKPIEELYDTRKDPWELNNLAELPEYAKRLTRMRAAVEQWQEEIEDTGLVPEAVLMEEMKPRGQTPQTEPPSISVSHGRISIDCTTEGASIVFRTREGSGWSDWLLFTKSFKPAGAIQAQACRLGYRDSKIVAWKWGQ
jgi:hypothetical protein